MVLVTAEREVDVAMRRTVVTAGLLVIGLLAGCGDGETVTGSGGTAGTGGVGGSGGTGGSTGTSACDACPAGSHEASDCACEATLAEWAAGPPLNAGRDHHVTFLVETKSGPFLYVGAGASTLGAPLDGVERAAVAEDGSLGAFEKIEKLPKGLVGPGIGQAGSGLVIGGGLLTSGDSTAETWVGAVGDDGHLTFTAGAPLTTDRYHVAMIAAKGFVFALGGLQQKIVGGSPMQTVLDVVERASFDGKVLGDFAAIGTLPGKLTHHTVFYHNDALYVLGGGSGATATTDVVRATLSDAGELGEWQVVGQLPEARATASATVFLDQLYVFAGMKSLVGEERDTVLRAGIAADGSVGAFSELLPLPSKRAHCHQTPLFAGHFYSAGGSINHKGQKDVYVGKLE